MKSRALITALGVLFAVTVITPSTFFIAPQSAYAQVGVPTVETPGPLVTNTFLTEINSFLTEVNTWAQRVNTYVLQPIALIKSGNLLKAMTAGVVAYVNGVANGTGASQFVQNLSGNLQRVGDTQALAFFAQFGRNSNSPFASAITSSLRTNYLQNTSMAGFWAANRSTLSQYSPNVNSFLAGNWSQGGVRAWFALTTQSNNNPYTLYQASQSQLASVVGSAQAARTQTLAWGQGMLSWCGPAQEVEGPVGGACTSSSQPGDACTTPAGVPGTCAASELGTECVPKTGVNPGDSCYQSDGTAGQIKTPGSVISASLNKVLGANQDKLVQLGNVAKDAGNIMNNLAGIWQTIQFARQVLGGSDSGGLSGLGSSGSNPNSRPIDPGTVDPNPTVDTNPLANSGTISGMLSRITQYESAWNTIKISADTASTTVTSLMNFCTTAANTASTDPNLTAFVTIARGQATDAQTAFTSKIIPLFAQYDAASTTIRTAREAVRRVEATTGTPSYTADVLALKDIPPSTTDVYTAQQNAQASDGARTNPPADPPLINLNVSNGSLVDQMNLIITNATALRPVCTPGGVVDTTSGGGG